jgi:hypothetical protein
MLIVGSVARGTSPEPLVIYVDGVQIRAGEAPAGLRAGHHGARRTTSRMLAADNCPRPKVRLRSDAVKPKREGADQRDDRVPTIDAVQRTNPKWPTAFIRETGNPVPFACGVRAQMPQAPRSRAET